MKNTNFAIIGNNAIINAMIKKICIGCKCEFTTNTNRAKYCTRECYFKYSDGKERIKSRRSYKGENNPFYGKKLSEEHKEAVRKSHLGKKMTDEQIAKIKDKLSNEKCYAWKGGISSDWWRKRVLEQHDFTCQICGLRDKEVVEADHIKPVHLYPELKSDLNNGMTLCANCHRRKTKKEHKKFMKYEWVKRKKI